MYDREYAVIYNNKNKDKLYNQRQEYNMNNREIILKKKKERYYKIIKCEKCDKEIIYGRYYYHKKNKCEAL